MRRNELVVLLIVLAIAACMRLINLHTIPPGLYSGEVVQGTTAHGLYANIVAVSVQYLGNTAYAIRLVSAVAGILTVLGTYLLTRRMFDDWSVSAMAAFLMATGFWHVNFSRIGFAVILAPLIAVWAFYYLYKAIETHRLWHWAASGALLGLGMYTLTDVRILPVAVALTFGAYWLSVRAQFGTPEHLHTRSQVLGGFALLVGIVIVVSLPLAISVITNPSAVVAYHPQFSLDTAARTLGMFFFNGDTNWRHNIAGDPILFWPVAALFAVGLIRCIERIIRSWRTKGHPGLPQTLLLSWFVVGLVPGILTNEGVPNALRALVVTPAVYIMAAQALHWLFLWLHRSYAERDQHHIVAIAMIALLVAIGFADASRYFVDWARNPNVTAAFYTRQANIAQQLNALNPASIKYVVTQGDSAISLMYLTDTATPAQQSAKHIVYLTPTQFAAHKYPAGALVFQL